MTDEPKSKALQRQEMIAQLAKKKVAEANASRLLDGGDANAEPVSADAATAEQEPTSMPAGDDQAQAEQGANAAATPAPAPTPAPAKKPAASKAKPGGGFVLVVSGNMPRSEICAKPIMLYPTTANLDKLQAVLKGSSAQIAYNYLLQLGLEAAEAKARENGGMLMIEPDDLRK